MIEELKSMVVREVKEFPVDKYESIKSTINRLKRNGLGQWSTCYGGFKGEKSLTVKRIK